MQAALLHMCVRLFVGFESDINHNIVDACHLVRAAFLCRDSSLSRLAGFRCFPTNFLVEIESTFDGNNNNKKLF